MDDRWVGELFSWKNPSMNSINAPKAFDFHGEYLWFYIL